MRSMKPAILERLRGVQRAGDGWLAFCPAHPDLHKRSLSVRVGADGRTLLKCHAAGCPVEQITAAVAMTLADLAPPAGNGSTRPSRATSIVSTYDYTDERGALLYQVCRLEPKDFRMRRPDGNGWTWDVKGVRRVVYRLHELAEAERVYVVEGEKDADHLVSLGLRATTTPGGAANFRDEYAAQILAAGVAEVVVLPDRDEAGDKYAAAVTRALLARRLRAKMVLLPGLAWQAKHGPDVSDWLDGGHTVVELMAAVDATPWLEDAPETPGPRQTMTAEDGELVWPDGAGVSFARVVEGSRGVQAEVTVTWHGRVLGDGTLNLLAPRSRDGLAKKLERKVPDVLWEEYLDLACRQMVTRLREGEPVERLIATPRAPEQYLVRPVLAAGDTTVTFGPGGSGKSLYALALEVAVTTGCVLPGGLRAVRMCPVLVLDWESSKAAHEARLYELCRALGITPPTTLYYKRLAGPLSDSIRQIRADVARLGVGLVRIDSLALAAGREPEGADASTRTMNDLRTLGDHVTRHVVAHVAKTGLDTLGVGHVYGSVFNENIPRNVYELRRTTDAADDEQLVLACYHRKANESRLHPPFGLRFTLSPEDTPAENKTIVVEACPLGEAPDLLARASLVQQLKAALSNGGKTIPALAVELDAKEDTLDKALRRHPTLFTQLPGEKSPYRWGLAQR